MKPTTYGYARCSTTETKQDVSRQVRELMEMGASRRTIYYEYESSVKINRIELTKLLCTVKPGDTIVTTEVSRLTRSTRQLCDLLEQVNEMGLRLIIGTLAIDCRAQDGKIDVMTTAMLKMMGVFAELEREMTIERIKSGVANARAKGVRLGRPKLTADQVPKKAIDMFPLYKDGKICKTDYARLCGVCRTTIYRYIELLTDG